MARTPYTCQRCGGELEVTFEYRVSATYKVEPTTGRVLVVPTIVDLAGELPSYTGTPTWNLACTNPKCGVASHRYSGRSRPGDYVPRPDGQGYQHIDIRYEIHDLKKEST